MQPTNEGRLFTEIVLEIFKLGGLLITAGDELTRDLGLTSARWKVLGALARSEVPMTVSQIATSMGQSRQGVQRLSDTMSKAGILAYEDNPLHKKAKLVVLTPQGRTLYDALEQKQIPWAIDRARNISAEEMEIALGVLHKMTRNLEP